MPYSSLLSTYLGSGVFASRPVAATIAATVPPGWVALWYATDTSMLYSIVNGASVWTIAGGGAGSGMGPPGMDGADAEEPLHIPGPPGPTGATGATGAPGGGGGGGMGPPGMDGADAEEAILRPSSEASRPVPASAKYWRLRALYDSGVGTGNTWASLGEVQFKDASGTVLSTGGTAIAGSWFNGTFAPSTAFDGVLPSGDIGWLSESNLVQNTLGYTKEDAWLGYVTPAAIAPTQVTIYPHANYPSATPTQIAVEFSLDQGMSWKPVVRIAPTTPVVGTPQTFAIPPYLPV